MAGLWGLGGMQGGLESGVRASLSCPRSGSYCWGPASMSRWEHWQYPRTQVQSQGPRRQEAAPPWAGGVKAIGKATHTH